MRPRLLDLFCGAGGAAVGYERAGFEVVGVDIEPQPNYPYVFSQRDALEVLKTFPPWQGNFVAIHASPPCQAYSKAWKVRSREHPDLIPATRKLLQRSGLPYVIENVPGAPLHDPVELCGATFGLNVYRHRLFECSFPVTEPLHGEHWLPQVKMGRRPKPGEVHQPVGNFSDVKGAREAMGVPWMTRDEIREAIPPAYTEHIGHYLMLELQQPKDVAA